MADDIAKKIQRLLDGDETLDPGDVGEILDTMRKRVTQIEKDQEARAAKEEKSSKAGKKAGRPKGAYGPYKEAKEKAVVPLTFRVTEAAAEAVKARQEEGESLNQTARRLLLEALDVEK